MLFAIDKYFDNALSSRFLSVHKYVFPNKSPLGTYFRILNLLIESYSSKRVLTSLDYKRKRLLMENLLTLVSTIKDVNLLDDDDKLGYFFLQTLFIYLLTPWVPPKVSPIPKLSDFKNLIVPKNPSKSSCFCDAVLVAMFLSTHENDRLLNPISFSERNFYPWKEEVTNRFLSVFDKKVAKSILMTIPENSCNITQAKVLIELLMDIVIQMRDVPDTVEDRDVKRKIVGQKITVFRQELKDRCAIGTPLRQEDAPGFLVNMVRLNYMSPVLFPLVREIRSDSFYSGRHRLEVIPNLVNFDIGEPSITRLNPGEGKTPRTLQSVITSEYFPNIEIESLKTSNLFKEGSTFANHINKFTKIEDIKNLNVKRRFTQSFIKLPKLLILEMSRAVSTKAGARKIKFDIVLPDSMQLTIPVFESTNNTLFYRIIAIVCHISAESSIESGHYITYFLPHEEKSNWLLYNDMEKQMLVNTDITKSPHAKTIKKNAVLYFLIRE